MQIRYEPTAEEQIIINYLVPEEKYQSIFLDCLNDTNRQHEMIHIMDFKDRFLKIVMIRFQLSSEEESILKRRSHYRFKNLCEWIKNHENLVPEDTQFPFTENE